MTAHVLQWVLSELTLQRKVVMATVLNTSGSVPGKTGARLAMSSDNGAWTGTVGGAGLEHRVLERCKALLVEVDQPFAPPQTVGPPRRGRPTVCGGAHFWIEQGGEGL